MNRYVKDVIRGKKPSKVTPYIAIPFFLYACYLYIIVPFYKWVQMIF